MNIERDLDMLLILYLYFSRNVKCSTFHVTTPYFGHLTLIFIWHEADRPNTSSCNTNGNIFDGTLRSYRAEDRVLTTGPHNPSLTTSTYGITSRNTLPQPAR
jgi:hypothetical protein